MNKAKLIRILLVDDHAIVREGYRSLLQKQPGMTVIAEADDAAQAYLLFKDCLPDITIMDLGLPGASGFAAITRIKQRCADAKILVFSMHQNPAFAAQAIRAGALGYVTKSSPPDELLHAITQVHTGHAILSADIAQSLALENLGTEQKVLETLSPREFEILRLLMAEKSNDYIAKTLNISPKTVANCHYLIKSKLDVNNDIELTKLALKMKIFNLLE